MSSFALLQCTYNDKHIAELRFGTLFLQCQMLGRSRNYGLALAALVEKP